MTGLPDDYQDMYGTNDMLNFLTRIWYWLYILIIFFILMNAFLAIVVDAYAEASTVPKTWREPLVIWFEYTRRRLTAAEGARALFLTNAQLVDALDQLSAAAPDADKAAKFAADLDAAAKVCAAAKAPYTDAVPGRPGPSSRRFTPRPGRSPRTSSSS